MTTWSPQQNEALSKAGAWLRMKWTPFFYLAGYAGTGKTTLAMHLAEHASGPVAFAAYTGKAAGVMRSKGCRGARTIHSLIYNTEIDPVTGESTTTRKNRTDLGNLALIIIDECSMVNEEIGLDLLFFGVPILVLGDPAQLPPVNGGGYFTSRQPDYMLTEVHRQAADSPIIRLATAIRESKFRGTPTEVPGMIVCSRQTLEPARVTNADIVLVGKNETRMKYNKRLRERRGILNPYPQYGESLICLRNDKEKKIANGEIFRVTSSENDGRKKVIQLVVEDPDSERKPIKVQVFKRFFINDVEAAKTPFKQLRDTQQFTYGYAITCHKSQGSQWSDVCVFDESRAFRDDRSRWLYTAVTRASDHLTLVI